MQEDATENGWAPESSASFWVNRASRAILRLHDGRLREHGFGMSQLPVLFALVHDGPLSQKELARLARVEQPTMTEMVGRLERDGVVEKRPDPDDRRASLVSLTRSARARVPRARAALLQGEAEAMAGFTDEEKATLIALLRRVVENVDPTGGRA